MTRELTTRSPSTPRGPARAHSLFEGLAGIAGSLIMLAALAIATAVAVVFAATLALFVTLAVLLLALSAVAWRARPRMTPRRALAPVRVVGHAWVGYGLERPSR